MTQFKNAAVKSMVVMRKAFRTIDAKVSESFREFGLTPTQFGVLDVLFAKEGAMKIGELIDSMLATSGNMTVVIKNMEKNGWVTRMTCPTDKRAYLVTLTEAGRDLIQKALPAHIVAVEETFSVLTEEEQEQLIELLKKFKNS
ncbi:MarR family winged helix-turn-helix transcriptional regulator [Streptococcus orisratti]